MANKNDYIIYRNQISSIKTAEDFVGNLTSIVRTWSIGELYDYQDENSQRNVYKIWNSYTIDEKEKYQKDFDKVLKLIFLVQEDGQQRSEELKKLDFPNLPISTKTYFALPKSKLNVETIIGEGTQIQTEEFDAFITRALKQLVWDRKNEPRNVTEGKFDTITEVMPNISVWLWSKALSKTPGDYLDGSIIDITKFVQNVSTSVGPNGGNFNIKVSPVIGYYDESRGWVLEKDTMAGNIYKNSNGVDYRNIFFLQQIISENDIVFIRFETLNSESESRDLIAENNEVDKTYLPNNIYDMIGLVDTIPMGTNAESNSVDISIVGRDLMKLLIEDGSYFYPLDYIQGGMFGNEVDDRFIERIDGRIESLAQGAEKSIEFSLKFIINALSKIKICNDDLFSGYKNTIFLKDDNKLRRGIINPVFEFRDTRSREFRLNIAVRKAKMEKQSEIRSLQKEAYLIIQESRKIAELFPIFNTGLSYTILHEFLVQAEDKGKMRKVGININWDGGWIFFYNNVEYKVKVNELPIILDLQLIKFPRKVTLSARTQAQLANNRRQAELRERIDQREKERDEWAKQVRADFQEELDAAEQRKTDAWNDANRYIDENYPKEVQDKVTTETYGSPSRMYVTDLPYLNKYRLEYEAADKSYINLVAKIRRLSTGSLENQFKGFLDGLKGLYDDLEALVLQGLKLKGIDPDIIEILTISLKELASDNLEVQKSINKIYQVIVKEREIGLIDTKYEEKVSYGIWQIIKLVIDDEISSRRIVDNTIGNENTSMMSYFQKVCQQPFVEFYSDTIKDQFYFIARRPPFTKKKIFSCIENDIVIDIDDSVVLDESLQYDNTAYSWYRIQPQGTIGSEGLEMAFAYIKAVHFGEYADIWGEKPLDVPSNYIPYKPKVGLNRDLNINNAIKQAIVDLKFIIDINCYLPFTRRGRIVINGDRRIKRGTFIRYKNTREMFYVDSVSHSFAINSPGMMDRETVLEVSRGMIMDNGKTPNLDYFNIINTNIDFQKLSGVQSYDEWTKQTLQKWKVNKDVFDRMIKRTRFNIDNLEEPTNSANK